MSAPRSSAGRTYRGAAPRQRQEERRDRLVEAAVEVFGTTGYRTATVDRICAAAGLTKRYFYESFDSSEDLLLAAYERVTGELQAALVTGAGDDAEPLTTRVRGALDALFRTIEADPRVARIVLVEVLGVSPAVDRAYHDAIASFVGVVVALVEPALPPGGGVDADLTTIATGVVGAVLMIVQSWAAAGFDRARPEVVASAHHLVMAIADRLVAE